MALLIHSGGHLLLSENRYAPLPLNSLSRVTTATTFPFLSPCLLVLPRHRLPILLLLNFVLDLDLRALLAMCFQCLRLRFFTFMTNGQMEERKINMKAWAGLFNSIVA